MDFKFKTLFTLTLFLGIAISSYGQGKLTFTEVKFLEFDGTVLAYSPILILDTETVTIPAGEVWKIESAGVSAYTNFDSWQTTTNALINMNDVPIAGFGYSSSSINPPPFPIWLKPGTYTFELIYRSETSQDRPCKGFISALVFSN